jgi:hypothetical protein
MPEYQPGVCNIGSDEIRQRYALAFMGFMISAALISSIILYHLPRLSLLISFIPLVLGFEGLYQARFKFCAGFAAKGIYDVGDSKKKVMDPKDHLKDMKKARQIHIYSIVCGIAIAVAAYLIG